MYSICGLGAWFWFYVHTLLEGAKPKRTNTMLHEQSFSSLSYVTREFQNHNQFSKHLKYLASLNHRSSASRMVQTFKLN